MHLPETLIAESKKIAPVDTPALLDAFGAFDRDNLIVQIWMI